MPPMKRPGPGLERKVDERVSLYEEPGHGGSKRKNGFVFRLRMFIGVRKGPRGTPLLSCYLK